MLAFALPVVLAVWGFLAERRLTVTPYTISSPDLPPEFDGVRMAFLTDIHRGPYFSQERLDALVEEVNSLGPDLIVLGGDYVYSNERLVPAIFNSLGRLDAPLGVYGVLGNHDHYNGAERARRGMAAAGIAQLDNQATWIGRGDARIRLGGVGDLDEDVADVAPTLEGTGPGDFVLLVSHQPDIVPSLPEGAVDLVLAGHTHGGQVTVLGWAPILPSDYGQRYRTGLVEGGPAPVIVSNGIGTIILPLRLWAPAQLVVVELKRA